MATCCGEEASAGDAGEDLRGKIARLMPDMPDKVIKEYQADAQRRFARAAGI